MLKKTIEVISRLEANNIYLLRVAAIPAIAVIVLIISYRFNGAFYYFLVLLAFILTILYIELTSVSIRYVLYHAIDLKKWEILNQKLYRRETIPYIANLTVSDYYKGSFDKVISNIISNMKFVLEVNKRKEIYKFLSLVNLCKSGIMTGNEKLIAKSHSELKKIHFKNAQREKWRQNETHFCNLIHDIVILKQVNDDINNWTPFFPQGKVKELERTYFQALNEQLKGNEEKAREFFEQLTQENEDLYFVKEAKKHMTESS